jgi:sigma-B regulation protein RsbU (phosphoserine phosphatase)
VLESAAPGPGPGPLTAALEGLPEGVALFAADWTICYINPAGAALVDRRAEELAGRNIWVALPELGGTGLHSFLLQARSVGTRATWRGFYAPARRWLSVTAVVAEDLLHVYFRDATDQLAGRPDDAAAQPLLDAGADADADADADRDRLRFLAHASEVMFGTLDTGESAAQLAELVVSRLCDWAVVAVLGEDGRPTEEEARAHLDPARRADLATYLDGRIRGTGDDSPLLAALLTGEPVHLPEIDPALAEPALGTEEVRAAWRRLDVTSCTIVPLRARAETIGAVALMNTGDRPPHTEMEIATAVEVARRASVALDNARLYGRQLQVAETLQRSLLTPPPQPDQMQVAVRYQPAASNMHVGGDWYDAFQQPDGGMLLVIGDVVGHSVDAAAAMGQIRSILRGIAYDRPESPAQVLRRVDGVLTGLRIGTLATAQVARLEQSPKLARKGLRKLRWSSAGHLPPMLIRAAGTVDVLGSPAERLLGTDSARPRTNHSVVLHPRDTVVFYTDGIVEHGRTGIDEGITRLTGVLEELRDLPLEELCDRLLSRIVGTRTDDDIAILAVRCDPENDPASSW